jgi:hypothetical protein
MFTLPIVLTVLLVSALFGADIALKAIPTSEKSDDVLG